jgi:hypothetical protein
LGREAARQIDGETDNGTEKSECWADKVVPFWGQQHHLAGNGADFPVVLKL